VVRGAGNLLFPGILLLNKRLSVTKAALLATIGVTLV